MRNLWYKTELVKFITLAVGFALVVGVVIGMSIRDYQNQTNPLDIPAVCEHVDFSIAMVVMGDDEDIVDFFLRAEKAIDFLKAHYHVVFTIPVVSQSTGSVDRFRIIYKEKVNEKVRNNP